MYESDRLWLSSVAPRVRDGAELVEEFAQNVGVGAKDALRLTLLVEETVGMVRSMVDRFEGELWLEGDSASCVITLEARARIDWETERRLIAASSAGKNEADAPKGFMAKIARLLRCAFLFDGEDAVPDSLLDAVPGYMSYGLDDAIEEEDMMLGRWSLNTYRTSLQAEDARNAGAQDALDELEKSIVARLADDVTVGIRGERIKLVITKSF